MPDSIGRTAYRMVQESLTNARKHAPNTQVDVIVTGRAGRRTERRGAQPDPRRAGAPDVDTRSRVSGCIGLAERATLAHGRFEHGPHPEGDFVVRAWLPWAA